MKQSQHSQRSCLLAPTCCLGLVSVPLSNHTPAHITRSGTSSPLCEIRAYPSGPFATVFSSSPISGESWSEKSTVTIYIMLLTRSKWKQPPPSSAAHQFNQWCRMLNGNGELSSQLLERHDYLSVEAPCFEGAFW